MINLEKAYKIFLKENPGMYSATCSELKDCFVFYPRPVGMDPSEHYATGTVYPAVDKNRGKIFMFDLFKDENLVAMDNSVTYKLPKPRFKGR